MTYGVGCVVIAPALLSRGEPIAQVAQTDAGPAEWVLLGSPSQAENLPVYGANRRHDEQG